MLSNRVATQPQVATGYLKCVTVTEELNFKFSLILNNLNINLDSYMWLVATVLGRASLRQIFGSSPLLTES